MNSIQSIFCPQTLEDFPYKKPASYETLCKLQNGKRKLDFSHTASGKKGIFLHGPNGTGKSTLANLLPAIFEVSHNFPSTPEAGGLGIIIGGTAYITSHKVSNSNAISLVNGIQQRNGLMGSYSPKGWRYEVIDEASQLTSHAQGALKALMDDAHCTIFIFVSNNELGFDSGLKSRCYCIEMGYASMKELVNRAQGMLSAGGVMLTEQVQQKVHRIAQNCGGDLRELGSGIEELLGDICGGK